MFSAACDDNSLPSVVGLSSHLVLPPTVCGCPGFERLCRSRVRSGEKSCPRGPQGWGFDFILLFPECPSKAGGCVSAWEVLSLTSCWGRGSGRWEHPCGWVTAGTANLQFPTREEKTDLQLDKGRAEECSVFACTHLNGSCRAVVTSHCFVQKWSWLEKPFRTM